MNFKPMAHTHLVNFALANGHTVSVHDGEEWAVKRSTDAAVILDAIQSVDESQLVIRDTAGDHLGWAFIVLDGAEIQTVNDTTVTEFMELWEMAWDGEVEKREAQREAQ